MSATFALCHPAIGNTVPLGTLLLSDVGAGGLFHLDPTTGALTPLDTGTTFVGPGQFEIGPPPGYITYVSDCAASQIVALNPISGDHAVLAQGGLLVCPWAIALSNATGHLFVYDIGPVATPDPKMLLIDVTTGQVDLLWTPEVMVSAGIWAVFKMEIALWSGIPHLVISQWNEFSQSEIVSVNLYDAIVTVRARAGHLVAADGMRIEPSGDILVADAWAAKIVRIDYDDPNLLTNQTLVASGPPLAAPVSVTDTLTGEIAIADQSALSVVAYDEGTTMFDTLNDEAPPLAAPQWIERIPVPEPGLGPMLVAGVALLGRLSRARTKRRGPRVARRSPG